jgi:hypothetical protein
VDGVSGLLIDPPLDVRDRLDDQVLVTSWRQRVAARDRPATTSTR